MTKHASAKILCHLLLVCGTSAMSSDEIKKWFAEDGSDFGLIDGQK